MKRTAIVVDCSGSIDKFIQVFGLHAILRPVVLELGGGCDPKQLNKLSKDFDEIYFFTDNFIPVDWNIFLNPKIKLINIMR